MNRMRKKIIIKAVLGFLLGLLIGVIFMMAEGKPETYLGLEGTPAVVLYMLCCAAYGLAVMTGQLLYDIESLSLIQATLTHFLIIAVGMILLGLSFGWRADDAIVWIIVAVYLTVSVLIWIIMYLFIKRRVRRMNENIRRWKSVHSEDGSGRESE